MGGIAPAYNIQEKHAPCVLETPKIAQHASQEPLDLKAQYARASYQVETIPPDDIDIVFPENRPSSVFAYLKWPQKKF